MSTGSDAILGRPAGRIMLLGTFHFQDAGRDRYQPQFAVDILSEQRQQEVAEVVERLAGFQPTRVAVELTPRHQEEVDRKYRAYLRGEFELPANEVYQLGFRLAARLGHEKVYCVNAWGRHYSPPVDMDLYEREHGGFEGLDALFAGQTPDDYAKAHGQEHLLSEWWPRFQKLCEQGDEGKTQRTLRETLRDGNTEAAILRGHGSYMVDRFKVGAGDAYPGADWVTGWYNRNLRIFANLQRITEAPDDRILLIIGGGHVPILRHCVEASPEYELVEVEEFL